MLKKMLFALMFAIVATVTHAESDLKTVASKAYVDTQIETKQLKIPAAGQPNVGAGETVMTYTATGNGQIGERALYSDISSYDATTDGDKLITASALNATFTNLPTTPTTKLECANESDGCTLWTIVDQTAYHKPSKNLFDESQLLTATGWAKNNDGYYYGRFTPWHRAFKDGFDFKNSFKENTAYTVSCNGYVTENNARIVFRYTDGTYKTNYIQSTTPTDYVFTSDSTKTLNSIEGTYGATPNAILYIKNMQVEEGSTATEYEPYY